MTAPPTAPIGPSTKAPDTAPNAASPARSPAIAAEGISATARATLAILYLILSSQSFPLVALRWQRPNDDDVSRSGQIGAWHATKKPRWVESATAPCISGPRYAGYTPIRGRLRYQ